MFVPSYGQDCRMERLLAKGVLRSKFCTAGRSFERFNEMIMAIDKYALITGATSGIGYELAKLFAKDGYNLVIVARTESDLQRVGGELERQHNIKVLPIAKSLFDPNAPFEIYNEVKRQGIEVNVLVNDAGMGEHGFFTQTDLKKELDIIQLNVVSLVCLTKLFLKEMVARNEGKILQLSSVVGKIPSPLMAVYSGTKAFVYVFSQSVINELKGTNVTMTVLLPGATDTDFFNKAGAEDTKVYQDTELADPADVAKDGYNALMDGESKIVSGFRNKMQVTMANVMPEQKNAEGMRKQMEEKDKDKEGGIDKGMRTGNR